MFDVWHLLLHIPTAALVAATPGPVCASSVSPGQTR